MAERVRPNPSDEGNDSPSVDGRSRRVQKDPSVQLNVKVPTEVDEMIWDLVERRGVPKRVIVEDAIRAYHRAASTPKGKRTTAKK